MSLTPLQSLCRQLPACIVCQTPSHLTLAVTSTPPQEMLDALHFASQCQLLFEYWPQARIEQQLRQQQLSPPAGPPLQDIPELAQQLLEQATRQRASDIHIDPQAEGYLIRLRIDGILHPLPLANTCPGEALIARFKVLAGLDIAETRRPQDGKLTADSDSGQPPHSFRLSTLPAEFGEKMVLRRQYPASTALLPEQLGLAADDLLALQHCLDQPQGMILVTGPTGSGKTLTLYSLLNALNSPQRNLVSAEDPIEISLPGVNQSQVNPKAGLSFSLILRALLRQDPDVIMIGEIRDDETAEIAVKAAQTGHLVLATLHTNSPPEAIIRLRQMGIPGYLLADSLRLIIAQRLVRTLCQHCRRPAGAPLNLPETIAERPLTHWQACGCDHCFGGYYGRRGLFCLLPISGKLSQAIAADSPPATLSDIALQQGMRPLLLSGLQAIREGETSWSEVVRVTGGING